MQSETELLNIGLGFLNTFKYKKAIEFFTQVIEVNPICSEAFELRGISWFKIYNIDEALNDTAKAIELDELNHRAWYNQAEILKYKKEYEKAELSYRQADKIYPDSLFYLTGLIETAAALKKYDEAIGYCTQILKEKPADRISLWHRSSCYAAQLNYHAAIKDVLKIIEIGKPTSDSYNNLGFWYSKINDLKRAKNNLAVSIQLNPTHPYALNNLGYVKYLEGEYSHALELINNGLEIAPSNSYGYKNRALVYIKTGESQLALQDLQKAKALGYSEEYDSEVDKLLESEFGIH